MPERPTAGSGTRAPAEGEALLPLSIGSVRTASSGARYYLGTLALVGVLVYVPIVDLGVSAGRIHHGVSVAGVDVGGLTEPEAAEVLARRVELVGSEEVFFFGPGIRMLVDPVAIGWRPKPAGSAEAAMRIGREGGLAGALADRWRGWFGGIELRWAGKPSSRKVRALVDEVERRARKLGYVLDRVKFRRKIKRGINTWPRRPLRIPVTPA
jgi:hypothetical protein